MYQSTDPNFHPFEERRRGDRAPPRNGPDRRKPASPTAGHETERRALHLAAPRIILESNAGSVALDSDSLQMEAIAPSSARSGEQQTAAIPFPSLPVAWQTRAIEIPIALVALALSLPIILVIALIVRLGTPGPALFVQKRVGRGGRPFNFVKFRTLYVDARQRFPELYAYQYNSEQLKRLRFKVEDDPRVTPQGQWLRRTTLDELPNFWNVLTGDMALVGPRPEIPEMLQYYSGDMLRKFTVRPGITGIAQTSGRGRLGFHTTVDYDVQYVRERSLLLDLKILLKTARMVALRDGAF